MPKQGHRGKGDERLRAKLHARRITKWLLDSRLASEQKQLTSNKKAPREEAA